MSTHAIMTDVTSYISAQAYVLSERETPPPSMDPFALQSYAELIQSIFLYDETYVPHPKLLINCNRNDFGEEPRLLIALMERGVVKPLNLGDSSAHPQAELCVQAEKALLSWLQRDGADQLNLYLRDIEEDGKIREQENPRFQGPTLRRLGQWCLYHDTIRSKENSHLARVPTKDGIEDDEIGDFARSFAHVFKGKFEQRVEETQIDYLVATLVRGLRYRIRSIAADLVYHSHVMRRDFVLRWALQQSGVKEDYTREVIKQIHGLQTSLAEDAPQDGTQGAIKLLKYNVPLLGGKLWTERETALSADDMIKYTADRIAEYRDNAEVLRSAIRNVKNEEDAARFECDFQQIKGQLMEGLTPTERKLLDGDLAHVIDGIPYVGAMLVAVASVVKRKAFHGASSWQQFVFRELMSGFGRARKRERESTPAAPPPERRGQDRRGARGSDRGAAESDKELSQTRQTSPTGLTDWKSAHA